MRYLLPLALLAVLCLTAPAGGAQDADRPVNIEQQQPSFLVRADVNHASRSYREGDALTVKVVSEIDAYAYVLYHQADGKVFQIFPNSVQPDNRVRARQAVEIPASDDLFRWRIAAPFGKEKVAVIASKEPLDNLSGESLRAKRFNPLSYRQLKGVELELGRERPSQWAHAEVEITSYPQDHTLASGTVRRLGVFFGVAQYMFNAEREAASGGKSKLNLSACHRDARRVAEVLREVGALNDLRVFTNERATRQNLKDAVTGWLPSATKPDDTVFIFFSGHGMRFKDDSGGENAALLPHDFVSLDILNELVNKAKRQALEPATIPTFTRAVQVVRGTGSEAKAAEALVRETAVTDSLFGHWLQRLDGRQIVVILDICFAGGFAPGEKDLDESKAVTFDFLKGQLGRLKDLGQPETALLASSNARTTSAIRLEDDLSVMTYYLVEATATAPAQLTLPQGYEHCRGAMRDYFATTNERLRVAGQKPLTPHEPQLFNWCTKPIWLKP